MSAESELAKVIADAISKKSPQQGSTTMPAEYMGKDAEGKAWVLLPGAEESTPVSRMAVEAAVGDTVSVTVANGRAVIDSNISNPSAGIAGVRKVDQKATVAKETATQAIDYASAAQGAAIAAKQSADDAAGKAEEATESAWQANVAAIAAQEDAATAHAAADAAVQDAAIAHDAADRAQESADSAQASADSALHSAQQAEYGLAEVENVVGTLNWIAQHGSFVLTADETPIDGKLYYTLEGGVYALTADTALADHKQYYALDDGEYVPVTSPDVSEIATYYERSGMAVTKVDNPTAGDMSTYFEAWVGDSVQNYIASHLWLDDYGLNLTVDTGSGYRLHEGTVDGSKPMGMYVLDVDGTVVSSFGETVQIGAESGAHVSISGNRLSFIANGQEVAYVAIDDNGESVFYMTKAIIVQDLRFAKWQWKSRDNENLSLRWTGSEQ